MTALLASAARGLALAILLALACVRGAWGQEQPATDPAQSQPADADTRALIEALRDDATRERLIAALEGAPGEAAATAAEPAQPRPIGTKVQSALAAAIRGVVGGVRDEWNQGRATLRRLGGLSRLDQAALAATLRDVAGLAAVAFGVLLAGRLGLRPVIRRLGRAAAPRGLFYKAVAAVAAILLDLALVLAGIVAGVAVAAQGIADADAGQSEPTHVELFVGAFFVAGWITAAIRAVLRPSAAALRPLPLTDARARYWSLHLSVIAVVLIFSEMMAGPIIAKVGSPITARATQVAVYVAVILYLAVLVVLNRKAPAAYFGRLAARDPSDLSLALVAVVAQWWHVVALAGLAVLAHQAMTASSAALPLLTGMVEVAAALAVGALALAALGAIAERGLRLPRPLTEAAPDLEARINVFIRPFLRLLRVVVIGLWLTFVLQAVIGVRPWDWIDARFGVDVVSGATSVVIVIALGLVAWLLVSGWIDSQIAPKGGQAPTARQLTLLALMRNVALVAVLVLVVIFGLSQLGVSVAPLLASAGVIGLALSWGSQKLVQDIINGVFIQFENAINVGDVVEAAGKIGSVEKLTIRSVSLRDVEGVFHVIPFSSVDSISNYMKGFSYHVADIAVGYRADIDAAKAAMLAAYEEMTEDPDWKTKLLGGIEWFGVNSLGESAVVLRARLKTRPGEQWAVGRAYAELVKKRFDAAGIEIPFPQMTLWFGGQPQGAPPDPLAGLATARPSGPAMAQDRPTRQTLRRGGATDADDAPGDGDR